MRQPHVTPVDAPREFQVNEAFFSCTDARGVIEGGNRVFVRISAYPEVELVNRPHNLIRHPDMPRVVFKLLWDTIQAGQPIAAYVKNLAKDGRYYWVLALVSPIPTGYLSIRLRPTSELFPIVQGLYGKMLEAERVAEARGGSGEVAMKAGAAVLQEALASLGFRDYAAFVRNALLPKELASRDLALAQERLDLFPPAPRTGTTAIARMLEGASRAQRQRYEALLGHHQSLAPIPALEAQLHEATHGILDQTSDLGFLALNIGINASKLGPAGKGISVVAEHLRVSATDIARLVQGVRGRVDHVSERLGEATFAISWLRVQFEMAVAYTDEIADELGPTGDGLSPAQIARRAMMLQRLATGFSTTASHIVHAFGDVATELRRLQADSDGLDRAVGSMLVAQVAGTTEAHRLPRESPIRAIFSEARVKSSRTNDRLQALHDVGASLLVLAKAVPTIVRDVQRSAHQLELDARALADLSAAAATP